MEGDPRISRSKKKWDEEGKGKKEEEKGGHEEQKDRKSTNNCLAPTLAARRVRASGYLRLVRLMTSFGLLCQTAL
eukprot:2725807-Pyramimonas_sp.AAC.1